MGIGKEISRKKIDIYPSFDDPSQFRDGRPFAKTSLPSRIGKGGGLPTSRARTTALKPPVAEGGPSAVPMGEPPGLVPGVGGQRAAVLALQAGASVLGAAGAAGAAGALGFWTALT